MGDMASGQVVNLLSNDVSRFDIMCIFLHYMWAAPVLTVIIMYLFVRDGGLPALCGFSVILSITLAQCRLLFNGLNFLCFYFISRL